METNHSSWFWKALIVLSLVLPTILTGCSKKDHDNSPPNSPPVAILSVSPTSGYAPLSLTITLSGSDPDGTADIKSFKLTITSESFSEYINSPSQISINRIFSSEGPVMISGQVTDSEWAISTVIKTVDVSKGP